MGGKLKNCRPLARPLARPPTFLTMSLTAPYNRPITVTAPTHFNLYAKAPPARLPTSPR